MINGESGEYLWQHKNNNRGFMKLSYPDRVTINGMETLYDMFEHVSSIHNDKRTQVLCDRAMKLAVILCNTYFLDMVQELPNDRKDNNKTLDA